MRIAVASDDKRSTSCNLTSAIGFMIYEIVKGRVKNQFYRCFSTPEYRRTGGITKELNQKPHRILEAVLDCSAVISYGVDKELCKQLRENDIKAFQTKVKGIKDVIDLFIRGKLIPVS